MKLKYKKLDILLLISFVLVASVISKTSELITQAQQVNAEAFPYYETYSIYQEQMEDSAEDEMDATMEDEAQKDLQAHIEESMQMGMSEEPSESEAVSEEPSEDEAELFTIDFELDSFYEQMKATSQNVTLYMVLHAGEGTGTYKCSVCLTNPEQAEEDQWSEDVTLVVSEDIQKSIAIKKQGEDYLSIMEQDIKIDAVIPQEETGANAQLICLYYENLDTKMKELLNRQVNEAFWLDVKIESNDPIDQTEEQVIRYAKEKGRFIEPSEMINNYNMYQFIGMAIGSFCNILLFILAFVNCVSISHLWIRFNEQNFMIRRAFGYTRGSLMWYVIRKFLKFSVLATVLTFGVRLVVSICTKEALTIALFVKLGWILLLMCIVNLLVILIHLKKIVTVNIAGMIRDV